MSTMLDNLETGVNTAVPPTPTELVEPEPTEPTEPEPTEPIAAQEPGATEVDGLTAGIQDERGKRQEAERQANFYRDLAMSNVQDQQPQEQSLSDDDLLDARSVEKFIDQKTGAIQQQVRQQMITQQEQSQRLAHSDYDTMVDNYAKDILSKNPAMYDALQNAVNPAEFAYQLAQSHPEYIQNKINSEKTKVTQNVTETINQNLNIPPTLGAVGGNSVQEIAKDWASASDADVEAEIQRRLG